MLKPEDKETAIRFARTLCGKMGWRMVVSGKGNARQLKFYGPNGERVNVWYPVDPRAGDCEIRDLGELMQTIKGGSSNE